MKFIIGKLYRFIDRRYEDYFYLLDDQDNRSSKNANNILSLKDGFILLDIGTGRRLYGESRWIKILSDKGLIGWFLCSPDMLEELMDE